MTLANIFIILALLLALYFVHKKSKKSTIEKRVDFIKSYKFPDRLTQAVLKAYPHLKNEDALKVIGALRDYFTIATIADGKMVSMPSQVVDIAWHEFLLFTSQYDSFCKKAFGRFFHHHPTEAMKSKTTAQNGIKLCWKIACNLERIDPKYPRRLPLLFAIDKELDIPDGFKYSLNCKVYASNDTSNTGACGGYCASHIGCSGGCGGGGDSGYSGGACAGGGDSGCSGGACGGGCGGA